MFAFDITPQYRMIPGPTSWGSTILIGLPFTEQLSLFKSSLEGLGNLSSDDVYTIIAHPLQRFLTAGASRDSLSYWELYSQIYIPGIGTQKTIGSLHINDIQKSSIDTLNAATHAIPHGPVWNWLGTYTNESIAGDVYTHIKEKSKWMAGVDGEGRINVANMRAWKNKIDGGGVIKSMDLCVCGNASPLSAMETVRVIIFSIIGCNDGGFVFIPIGNITSALVAAIHLFSQCFMKTSIVHTTDDKIYLSGEHYIGGIKPHRERLYKYCECIDEETIPFTYKYVESYMKPLIGSLYEAIKSVQTWRYTQYISGEYIDLSDNWDKLTGFSKWMS